MHPARKPCITETMYLAMERAADIKHEYRDGEIWAMAGASPRHNALASACNAQLYTALRGGQCRSLTSDQRIHVPAARSYCYPDVTVVCEEPQYHTEDPDSIINPRVIVEVLSRSTEEHDRGTKFEDYRSIESFQEYVLVAQDRCAVEVRRRDGGRRWLIESFGPGDRVELNSIGAVLDVDALYDGVFELRGDDRERG